RAAAWHYVGYDIAPDMLAVGRRRFASDSRTSFTGNEGDLNGCDYVVASGVFNVKLQAPLATWERYVEETVERLAALARRGFAFNCLTSYSDPERLRPDLYYADPCRWFDRCKRRYSRHVALLHDYGLYEFTLLVRT